ncbi:hypothetical protein VNO77_25354 [Canavalia gladiata]|uniref:Uncharacterized protein n=1 Tax=Canavalia gladiata TaxID=3824 RepID=A0AAN9LBE1_CANGL
MEKERRVWLFLLQKSLVLASIIYLKRFSVGNDGLNDFQSLLGPSATVFVKRHMCFPNSPSINRFFVKFLIGRFAVSFLEVDAF